MRNGIAAFVVLVAACQSGPPIAPAMTIDQRNEAIARDLLSNLTAGRYEAAMKNFDATMKKQLPVVKLREVAQRLTKQLGTYKTAGTATFSTEDNYRIVTLPAIYERANINVRVVFDHGGRVTGLFFRPTT